MLLGPPRPPPTVPRSPSPPVSLRQRARWRRFLFGVQRLRQLLDLHAALELRLVAFLQPQQPRNLPFLLSANSLIDSGASIHWTPESGPITTYTEYGGVTVEGGSSSSSSSSSSPTTAAATQTDEGALDRVARSQVLRIVKGLLRILSRVLCNPVSRRATEALLRQLLPPALVSALVGYTVQLYLGDEDSGEVSPLLNTAE